MLLITFFSVQLICASSFELEFVGKIVTKFYWTNSVENFKNEKYVQLIRVGKYEQGDSEVIKFANLSYLKYVMMENIGQIEVPVFLELPVLTTVNLARNVITHVLKKVLSEVPVRNVFLNQNKIRFVENGTFGNDIQWVNLACNNLFEFSENWFVNPRRLKRLNLAGNYLESLPENSFRNFYNLNDINLSYNSLIYLKSGTFFGRSQYDWLFLNNNNLVDISSDIFRFGSITINNINIAANQLIYLPLALLNKINIEITANIRENPWQCPCYENIRETLKTLKKLNGTILIEDGFRCKDKSKINIYQSDCKRPNWLSEYIGDDNDKEDLKNFCSSRFEQNLEM